MTEAATALWTIVILLAGLLMPASIGTRTRCSRG